MDDLQYRKFRFYIGWDNGYVLNLVINGWPSIQEKKWWKDWQIVVSFKPCYKWMTFNTKNSTLYKENGVW